MSGRLVSSKISGLMRDKVSEEYKIQENKNLMIHVVHQVLANSEILKMYKFLYLKFTCNDIPLMLKL
jgi:hypothetical protein